MGQDKVFALEKSVQDFRFDNQVAGVFDDMVDRSVPFYQEIQRMVGELAAEHVTEGSQLYDLGVMALGSKSQSTARVTCIMSPIASRASI